jgi:predicted membrane-bound mannosyltransferase
MSKTVFRGLVPLVVLGALLFRLPSLGLRPMHHDEANQAMKFGTLLETGEYRYDPADHHGPSLYYLTWVLAKTLGRTTTASLDEAMLRLLPALFGAGTVV